MDDAIENILLGTKFRNVGIGFGACSRRCWTEWKIAERKANILPSVNTRYRKQGWDAIETQRQIWFYISKFKAFVLFTSTLTDKSPSLVDRPVDRPVGRHSNYHIKRCVNCHFNHHSIDIPFTISIAISITLAIVLFIGLAYVALTLIVCGQIASI